MRARSGLLIVCTLLLAPPVQAFGLDRVEAKPAVAPNSTSVQQNVTPVCLDRSNIPASEMYWLTIPTSASQLATNEDYSFLSGQLIQTGAVDASACPLGGLWPDGTANACGLEKTQAASRYLQNVYDDDILAAARSTGVPPILIKQLIRYESQFWPMRWGFYHFGLGHVTYAGASMALFWNRNLFDAVSSALGTTTDMPNSLLSLMDAYCPTCPLRVDVAKARLSIPLLANVLLATCKQTTQVVFNATKVSPGYVVDYPTIWRLTLLDYNAGPNCVFDAVKSNYAFGSQLEWVGIAEAMTNNLCIRGVGYADRISSPYYNFP